MSLFELFPRFLEPFFSHSDTALEPGVVTVRVELWLGLETQVEIASFYIGMGSGLDARSPMASKSVPIPSSGLRGGTPSVAIQV